MHQPNTTLIQATTKDLGEFQVRRLLPSMRRRAVGPFVFFDHFGPAEFAPGNGMNVRPHPHIGLATVTYLFEGRIRHRDSLGSDQVIEPGAVNWMTAGKGIVHSERAPENTHGLSTSLHGIQCWVALPAAHEQAQPSFVHHPADSLPVFALGNAQLRLLAGHAYGHTSPVNTLSRMFYLDVTLPAGTAIDFPLEGFEAAAYVIDGSITLNELRVERFEMAVAASAAEVSIKASASSRIMLLGGESLGKRLIDWNFVASSGHLIERAKDAWKKGPRKDNPFFQPVPGDDEEFIPLPS